MRAVFHPAADREFTAALQYYQARNPGISVAIYEAVFRAVTQITENPLLAAEVEPGIRRLLVSPFRNRRLSHGIVYVVRGEEIYVVALMDMRRKPGYWQNRLKGDTGL